MNKRTYFGLVTTPVEIELKQNLLKGSVTTKTIKVDEVEVEPFEQGFHEGLSGTDDFQTISFD